MNARASFALTTAALAAVLVAGCSSSGGGSAASTTPPAVTTTTVTAAAPSTGDAVAGSSAPAAAATAQASSTATTRSSTDPSSESGSYAAFVGTWIGHSRTLTVDKDGGFSMDFRTYRNCSATVTTGCDRIKGNAIIDGGHVKGMITHVDNASTVIVTVYSSTDTQDVPVTNFTLGHDISHHALAAKVGPFAKDAPFCGPGAPNGYCGA